MEPLNPSPEAAPTVPTIRTGGEIVDCWNRIGVAGDSSCPELAAVVHCRNCPVYSAAGASLLDQKLPAHYRRDWTEHFSREKSRVVPGTNSVVLFRIGTEWLALPTTVFQEVIERRPIHSLPHRRQGIALGVINVRGELLVCVSLGRLLNIESAPDSVPQRLVVSEWRGSILAFPVDEIFGIQQYHPEELKPVPSTVAGARARFTQGLLAWGGWVIGCLDAELVFSTLNRSLT